MEPLSIITINFNVKTLAIKLLFNFILMKANTWVLSSFHTLHIAQEVTFIYHYYFLWLILRKKLRLSCKSNGIFLPLLPHSRPLILASRPPRPHLALLQLWACRQALTGYLYSTVNCQSWRKTAALFCIFFYFHLRKKKRGEID